MKKQTMMVLDTERIGFEVYHDLQQVMVGLSISDLLSLAKLAMNQVVAMAASDELARRRPGR